MNQTFLVESWGKSTAEEWFYAARGTNEEYVDGTPVMFSEMIESMMEKFVIKVSKLGFNNCAREQGTWRVAVAWEMPDAEEARSEPSSPKRARTVAEESPPASPTE